MVGRVVLGATVTEGRRRRQSNRAIVGLHAGQIGGSGAGGIGHLHVGTVRLCRCACVCTVGEEVE